MKEPKELNIGDAVIFGGKNHQGIVIDKTPFKYIVYWFSYGLLQDVKKDHDKAGLEQFIAKGLTPWWT